MFYRENPAQIPSAAEMSAYIHNPLWEDFCGYMEERYQAKPSFAFSKCSWEYGWNMKFKKGSRALCTVYPRENFFAVLLVIGRKEKGIFEKELSCFCREIQELYAQTKEANGQRWLVVELEGEEKKYEDVKRILALRAL